jgi:hypothetical protein
MYLDRRESPNAPSANKPLQFTSPQPLNPNGRKLFIKLMDKVLITSSMCGHYLQWWPSAHMLFF